MPGGGEKWGFRGRASEEGMDGWAEVKEGERATVKCQHQQ